MTSQAWGSPGASRGWWAATGAHLLGRESSLGASVSLRGVSGRTVSHGRSQETKPWPGQRGKETPHFLRWDQAFPGLWQWSVPHCSLPFSKSSAIDGPWYSMPSSSFMEPKRPLPKGLTAWPLSQRLYGSDFLEAKCGHVTKVWPMECDPK